MSNHTSPDDDTKAAEETEAKSDHSADRMPTDEEAAKAEQNEPVSEDVAKSAEEQAERGANVKGEGQI